MSNLFDEWAAAQNWNISKSEKTYIEVPEYYSRYAGIPSEWICFIREYEDLSTAEEDAWFLTFNSDDLGSFQHNEFEMMSLEAAEGDDDLTKEVQDFWDDHLVIVMSVGQGYEYYAIALKTGEVVHGCEPEFEETTVVAASFSDFVDKLVSGMIAI